ncbi:peroxidase [Aureimonas sp. Leaf454]|uniref:alpha/beta fold hydrolase n=1 Tax=Aureimonas sp. Leaf454 TaxID=1736381 RepID=UPI0006F25D63|nr:alpha/beta hydrolase [Aureimonas sp. Leaf454]KQT53719.1 peroxidase [Aureimonas sp. Leaf454]
MDAVRDAQSETVIFTGADGQRLEGTTFGAGGRPVLLLHGAGQTRHSWTRAAEALAASGFRATTLDQRGHGDSAWVDDGAYAFEDFGRDAGAVLDALAQASGMKPIVVGASLGGIAGLLAEYVSAGTRLGALVLVDVTPSLAMAGLLRIKAFMSEHIETGFASLEEAAAAVARYQPGRARSASLDGLSRNLRPRADGRLRWHWDPALIEGSRNVMSGGDAVPAELRAAAAALTVPTLLVRGGASDLVTETEAAEFRRLVPGAGYVDIADAGHMVAGERNDVFAAAIIDFLEGLPPVTRTR